MVRRPTSTPPVPPNLSPSQIRRCIERLERCVSELVQFDPSQVQKRFGEPTVMALEASVEDALAAAFGHGTPAYNRYKSAATLDHGPVQMRMGNPFGRGPTVDYDAIDAMEARQFFSDGKLQSIALLRQAIRLLADQLADQEADSTEVETPVTQSLNLASKVFIVHGHDEAALQGLARFLEKIDLNTIVLKEQPNQGRSIIEKFEACANEVGFAVVLLTPDDVGAAISAQEQNGRARQNVIFELGYFVGKLGRGKVCLLRKGDVEIPSDLHGVIYTKMGSDEGWKLELVKELKAAGLDFDANKMW